MPSRPPPPKPYETWLDYILVNPHRNGYGPCVGHAAAELAELRAELQKAIEERDQFKLYAGRELRKCCSINPPDPADKYLRTARYVHENDTFALPDT